MNEKTSRRRTLGGYPGPVGELGALPTAGTAIAAPPIEAGAPVPAADVVPAPPADAAPDDALVHLDPTLTGEPGAMPPISTAAPVLATEPSAVDIVQADARAERIEAGQEPGATGDPALDAVAGQPTIAIERGTFDSVAGNPVRVVADQPDHHDEPVSWQRGTGGAFPSIAEISAVLDRLSLVDPEGWHIIRQRHFDWPIAASTPRVQASDAVSIVSVTGPPQGRRRAGVTFGVEPKRYLARDLSDAAILALHADPLLAVSVVTMSEMESALDKGLEQTLRRIDGLAKAGKLAGRDAIEAKGAILALGSTLTKQHAAQLMIDAINGNGVDPLLAPDEKPGRKPGKPKEPKSTEARDEFGRDTTDKIARIVAQFDDAPPVLDKTNAKIRELNDLIDDLARRKPAGFSGLIQQAEAAKTVVREGLIREVGKAFEQPKTLADRAKVAIGQLDAAIASLGAEKPANFEKLIADARTTQDVIRDGLQKPYADFIRQQQDGLAVQKLILAGRVGEAEALRTIQQLQQQMGPLSQAQKDAVLATTEAMRAQARAIDDMHARAAKYTEAVNGIASIVQDATQQFVRGDLGQLIKNPGRLLDAFQTLSGRALFDKLFDGVFQDLQDQINGTSVVKDASERMATAVDAVTASTTRTTAALDALAQSAAGAASPGAPGGAIGGAIGAAGTPAANDNADIVVTGRRLGGYSKDPTSFFTDALGKVGTSIAKAFASPDTAARVGGAIGKYAGIGLQGAATGSIVAGVGKAVGIKLNSAGSQIGGAVGSFLPIPGGSIIGSVVGGLIGNLFGKKAAYGTATVTSNDQSGVSLGGNKANAKSGASSLAGAVQDGIAQIVQQLGGTLGSYNVSIGTYDGKYRVSTSGQSGSLDFGKKNKQKATLHDFGDDQAGAIAFAIADAIADGAIQGLSARMQQAIHSSTDINKALNEALKVQKLELDLGGVQAQINKAVRDFEDQAKERLRIATTYGFDIVAVEKKNAEDRAALAQQLATQQVGSLQKLVDEITRGSLFEGTAMERISALNEAITKAKADLDAGKDGAADTLADLYQQRLAASKQAYGTTSAYAADRAATLDAARAAIAQANARITTAQTGVSDPALATTNAGIATTNKTLDEMADQNARMIAALEQNNALMTAVVQNNDYSPHLFDVSKLAAV